MFINFRCARVFSDKLTNLKDKAVYSTYMEAQLAETFGQDLAAQCKESFYMVNFLRPDIFDEEGVLVQEAPKMYEPGGTNRNTALCIIHSTLCNI